MIDLERSDPVLTAAADLVGDSNALLALTDPSSSHKVVGRAWKNYLDFTRSSTYEQQGETEQNAVLLVQLLVYGAFVEAASATQSALSAPLKRVGLGWLGTWREINLRLAGQLYRHGLLMSRDRIDEATFSLQAALQCWNVVEKLDAKSSPDQRRIWRGMRAVVRLFFARRSDDPDNELRLAIEDFEISESCGDHTAEHYAMFAETRMRLFARTGEDTQLASAEACLADAKQEGYETAELLAARGQAFFCRGLRAMVAAGARPSNTDNISGDVSSDLAAEDIADFEDQEPGPISARFNTNALLAAATAFTASALWHSRSVMTPAMGLRNPNVPVIQRGQAWLRAAHARRLLGLAHHRQVEAAVADLRSCAEPGAPISGPYWPWALLEQARLLIRQHTEEAFRQAHESATQALRYAEDHLEAQSTLVRRLEALDTEIQLRLAEIKEDISQIRIILPLALIEDDSAQVAVAPLIYASRLLLSNAQPNEDISRTLPTEDRHVIRKVIDHLTMVANRSEGGARRFTASHAATLLILCDGNGPVDDCDRDVLRRCYTLARLSYDTDPGTTDPIQLFQLARAAGRYGRSVLRSATDDCRQTALELFNEAIDAYLRIAEVGDLAWQYYQAAEGSEVDREQQDDNGPPLPSLSNKAQHASLLGDTYLRRYALHRTPEDLHSAIHWLQGAVNAGNDTPEIFSLLGEALIRLGRRERNVATLRRGLELKATSHSRGLSSRESLSVSAAALRDLWRITRDENCYMKAIEMAARAVTADPEWPWPLLQLAEYTKEDQDQRRLLSLRPPIVHNMPNIRIELWDMIRNGESELLTIEACRVAARSREFANLVLGGRSKAYVLDDPHGLLSASLVLKPKPSRVDAEKEMARLSDFASYLSRNSAPWWADTVQPLAVVESTVEGSVVAVSRRERGRVLSSLISDQIDCATPPFARGVGRIVEIYGRTLAFLAIIHAWRGLPNQSEARSERSLFEPLLRDLKALGVLNPEKAAMNWYNSIPVDWPVVGKRDAHSDNWLVTDAGRIVALDLEATAFLPVGFEVAQLLEDMPLLPVNDEGISYRKALAGLYLSELGARMPILTQRLPNTDDDTWWTAYACFAARRAIFLLRKFSGRLPSDTSSSAAVKASARTAHARTVLNWASSVVPELADLYPQR